jgi:hypothetical protein
MKIKNTIGFFLLGLGSFLLLDTLFDFTLDLEVLKEYWGVFIILVGVNFLIKDETASNFISSMLGLMLSVLVFTLMNN